MLRTLCSPPCNRSHEGLPFVEAPAKAKLAGSIETQPGVHLAALSAFCIVDVPIGPARNKDVRREGIVFGFHCCKLGVDLTYGRSESLQCILKACGMHECSIEHIGRSASSFTRALAEPAGSFTEVFHALLHFSA